MSAERRRRSRLADGHPAYRRPADEPADTPQHDVNVDALPLPLPHATDAEGPLTDTEKHDLAVCETAIDSLRLAFARAGRALQVIQTGRLYRTDYPSFDAYVLDRWGWPRQHAYRLIAAWPLAERLSPIGDTLTESHVRELLPLADQHGDDAAVTVYQTIVETDGVRPTAAVIKDARRILPPEWDTDDAVKRLREWLTAGAPAVSDSPVEVFSAATNRVLTSLQRTLKPEAIQAAATEHPDRVKEFTRALREVADQIDAATQTETET